MPHPPPLSNDALENYCEALTLSELGELLRLESEELRRKLLESPEFASRTKPKNFYKHIQARVERVQAQVRQSSEKLRRVTWNSTIVR